MLFFSVPRKKHLLSQFCGRLVITSQYVRSAFCPQAKEMTFVEMHF